MWPPGQPRRAPAPDSRSRSAPGEVSRGGCLRRRTSRVQAKAGKRFAYAANGAPLKTSRSCQATCTPAGSVVPGRGRSSRPCRSYTVRPASVRVVKVVETRTRIAASRPSAPRSNSLWCSTQRASPLSSVSGPSNANHRTCGLNSDRSAGELSVVPAEGALSVPGLQDGRPPARVPAAIVRQYHRLRQHVRRPQHESGIQPDGGQHLRCHRLREVTCDERPGNSEDQRAIRAHTGFKSRLEPPRDVVLAERFHLVHRDVAVELPDAIRPQPRKRVGGALKPSGPRCRSELSNRVGQSRLGLGPRELARSGGVYSTEREQDQQRLLAFAASGDRCAGAAGAKLVGRAPPPAQH